MDPLFAQLIDTRQSTKSVEQVAVERVAVNHLVDAPRGELGRGSTR